MEPNQSDLRALLRNLFDAAVASADPAGLIRGRLPSPPTGRTVVVGGGKAAASMAAALECEWAHPIEGLVITPYGHAMPCRHIEVIEAAHPVPDSVGREATVRILELASGLGEEDLLICLISGGGSALLALPPEQVPLEDKRAVTKTLLRSGAAISEINCVRKHLSLVKGGRLAAAAHPARVVTLAISDVPGDDPGVIASGPTVPDHTTFSDALAVLTAHGITRPTSVLDCLRAGSRRSASGVGTTAARDDEVGLDESPKPGDPAFEGDQVRVLATACTALTAAAVAARRAGVSPVILGDDLEGEARELGAAHARLAIACTEGSSKAQAGLAHAVLKDAARTQQSIPRPPLVLLSGGETTVTVRGRGRGGRNTEYLLRLALALDGHADVYAVAADTDGIDGTETSAGAFIGPETLAECRSVGVDPKKALEENDSHRVFSTIGALLETGPTRTNVNDFRAILVMPR